MKRLIALLAGLAILMSMSVTSFAAYTDAIVANEDGTYTVALPEAAAQENAGKQTTIVAFKGEEITVDNVDSIQYIDQAAVTSFTFQLKDELTENVRVAMGGEDIDKQEIGTIFYGTQEPDPTPTPDPTYTVTGTVTTTSANKDFTAKLYAGDAVAYEAVVTAGTYTFADIDAGDYTLVIDKAAHIDYSVAVTVAADVAMGELEMIAGDTDLTNIIDVDDFTAIGRSYGLVDTDVSFDAEADTDGTGIIDVDDFTAVGKNYGATVADYAN